MECPKCGIENKEERKYCRKCGFHLKIICSICGFENDGGDLFCGECGMRFEEKTEIMLLKKIEKKKIENRDEEEITQKELDKVLGDLEQVELREEEKHENRTSEGNKTLDQEAIDAVFADLDKIKELEVKGIEKSKELKGPFVQKDVERALKDYEQRKGSTDS